MPSRLKVWGALILAGLLTACAQLPSIGPSGKDIEEAAARPGSQVIQLVTLDDAVSRRLVDKSRQQLFSERLGEGAGFETVIGMGDAVEVSVWEAPPATLFGGAPDPRAGVSNARGLTLPEQTIDREGQISVPFAGRIRALGRTPRAVADDIVARLKGKAHQPEALVRVTRSTSATVAVVGEVANSVRVPLTASGERLLDALAAAGGVRQPVNKVTLQITRGGEFHAMPLDQVIRDPRQNVRLKAGDVVTAIFQPFSFTALGATGKNEEIAFEAQGINLAQALARAGGLVDNRSSPHGLFVFRLEPRDTLDWPRKPVVVTSDGLVPVVYRLDLKDPASFFVMQNFAVRHKDILYVSNAPATELQKFLNLVFSAVYPVLNTIQVTR